MRLYLVYEANYDNYDVLHIETDLETAMKKAKLVEESNYDVGIELWKDNGYGSFERISEVWRRDRSY